MKLTQTELEIINIVENVPKEKWWIVDVSYSISSLGWLAKTTINDIVVTFIPEFNKKKGVYYTNKFVCCLDGESIYNFQSNKLALVWRSLKADIKQQKGLLGILQKLKQQLNGT